MNDVVNQIADLFKQEVPEIANGLIQVKEIARKPGVRAKVALLSWFSVKWKSDAAELYTGLVEKLSGCAAVSILRSRRPGGAHWHPPGPPA